MVAFGTSAPELVVSLKAALMGNSSISLGNVVGSNIANIALILGTAAMIRPISVQASVIRREIPIMIGISVLMIIFLLDGELGLTDGIIFFSLLIVNTFINIFTARKEKNPEVHTEFNNRLRKKLGIPISFFLMIGGLGFLVLGADFFVQGAVATAKLFNISDVIIGLTIVSIGTSLPELTTSVVASYKRESEILIGNVIGSNIFNILSILGITALIIPISSAGITYIDLGVMLFAALILLPLSKSGFLITRLKGALLLLGYIGYMYYLLPK